MAKWFTSRFPDTVTDVRSLEAWWKKSSPSERQRLYLTLDDLKFDSSVQIDTAHFPEQLTLGHLTLPASYQFAPGRDEDGITVQLPIEALMQIKPDHLERTVPGAIEDKVEAMIRALPKSVRRQLVPIPDFVKTIMPVIEADQQSLSQAVARCVTKRTGVAIDPLVWADHQLDARLKLRIEVVDSDGMVMDVDRDLNALQERLASQVKTVQSTEFMETYHDWPPCLDLEYETLTQVGGVQMKQFQRLVLHEGNVVLKSLFDPGMCIDPAANGGRSTPC